MPTPGRARLLRGRATLAATALLATPETPEEPPDFIVSEEEAATIDDLLVSHNHTGKLSIARPPAPNCASAPHCPLPVDLTLTLSNMFGIDETAGTFKVQGQVILQWHDPRLRMPSGIDRVQLQEHDVWTPQIDFYNQVGSLQLPATKVSLLGPTGQARVTKTMRFVGTFAHVMNYLYCAHALECAPPVCLRPVPEMTRGLCRAQTPATSMPCPWRSRSWATRRIPSL